MNEYQYFGLYDQLYLCNYEYGQTSMVSEKNINVPGCV